MKWWGVCISQSLSFMSFDVVCFSEPATLLKQEFVYWTELFKLKLSKITQERPRVTFASPTDGEKSHKLTCPGSDKLARKKRTGLSRESKGEGINSKEIAPSYNPITQNRHKRTHSAPNNFYHAEDYLGNGVLTMK